MIIKIPGISVGSTFRLSSLPINYIVCIFNPSFRKHGKVVRCFNGTITLSKKCFGNFINSLLNNLRLVSSTYISISADLVFRCQSKMQFPELLKSSLKSITFPKNIPEYFI